MMIYWTSREDLLQDFTLEKMMREIFKTWGKILQLVSKNFKWPKNLNDLTPSPYFLIYLWKIILDQSLGCLFFYLNFPILIFANVEMMFTPFKWPNYTNFYVSFFPLYSFKISSPPGWASANFVKSYTPSNKIINIFPYFSIFSFISS